MEYQSFEDECLHVQSKAALFVDRFGERTYFIKGLVQAAEWHERIQACRAHCLDALPVGSQAMQCMLSCIATFANRQNPGSWLWCEEDMALYQRDVVQPYTAMVDDYAKYAAVRMQHTLSRRTVTYDEIGSSRAALLVLPIIQFYTHGFRFAWHNPARHISSSHIAPIPTVMKNRMIGGLWTPYGLPDREALLARCV